MTLHLEKEEVFAFAVGKVTLLVCFINVYENFLLMTPKMCII